MTDTRKLIELAARSIGIVGVVEEVHKSLGDEKTIPVFFPDDGAADSWDPLNDHSDSDRLACQLGIDISWHSSYVIARAFPPGFENSDHVEELVAHDNTIEGKSAAVRQARLMVAAEIGRNL